MRKNRVLAVLAVTLSMLPALVAPTSLAAQAAGSYSAPARQAQTQKAQAAQPAQPASPLAVHVGAEFMRDTHFFPLGISAYLQRRVPQPVLVNSPTIQQMIHEGKLELSLADAIRLAIENNLNIDVFRYTTWIADAQVLSARAGTNGLFFDPEVTSTLQWSRQNIQISNPFISGTGSSSISSLTQKGAAADFGYSQGFVTGTNFNLSFNNNRSASTSPAQLFNPSINSSLAFQITQPLLRGFGLLPNEQFIIEAQNSSKVARDNLSFEVINVVASVENAYWNLAAGVQSVRAAQANVDWGQKNLQSAQAQLRIGTMAQLDVTTAESTLAGYQQALIQAQTGEQQAETILLNLITRNQMAAGLESIAVAPTDSLDTPPKVDIIPYADAVREAWQNRPDLQAQELTLQNNDIAVKAARNALLPQLNLTGNYSSAGLAGDSRLVTATPTAFGPNTNEPIVDANGNPVTVNNLPLYVQTPTQYSTSVRRFNAGLLDAWNILWDNNYPSYSFSLSLSLPLHNRAAQAASAIAQLQQRSQLTNVQILKNTIATDVRVAQIGVTQGVARVQAAVEATKLAQESLDAEQKKFELGVATEFEVTQYASILATDQSNEIQAKAQLLQAVVALNQALGRTLQVNNISISDAATGHVTPPAPLIPGTPIEALSPSASPLGRP